MITEKINQAQEKALHIIGNVKGGILSPVEALAEINNMYVAIINELRYPAELPVQPVELTTKEKQLEDEYNLVDKGK